MKASFGAFLNVTSFNLPDWRQQMRSLSELPDRRHIEVWLEWLPESPVALADLRSLLDGERTIIHAPFVGLSIASPWAELSRISVDRILRTCDAAGTLGAEVVTIHTGHVPFFDPIEMVLERVAQAYEYLHARIGNFVLAIENMHTSRGVTVHRGAAIKDLIALSDMVPDASFTLDVGHAIQNGEQYCEFFASHASRIVNIHLHDAWADGTAHLRLGTAQLDLDALLRCCSELDYDRFISMETIGADDTATSWTILRDTLNRLGL